MVRAPAAGHRWWLAGLWLALCSGAVTGITPAGGQTTPAGSEIEQLAHRLEPSLPRADVGILLDASGSMGGVYGEVRRSAIQFGDALQHRENLCVRVFGDSVAVPFECSGPPSGGALDAYLPAVPMPGLGTNLGLALEKAMDFLERPGASRVQVLFLLTDGRHEPRLPSPYGRDFASDPAWAALAQRGGALCNARSVWAYGLGLGGETDIGVLQTVFPGRNVEIIVGNGAEVPRALERVRQRMRLARIQSLLVEDTAAGYLGATGEALSARGVTVVRSRVGLRNCYQYLPLASLRLTLEPEPNGSSELAAVWRHEPEAADLEAQGSASGDLQVLLTANLPRWRPWRTQRRYARSWRIVPSAEFRDRAALADLGFSTLPRTVPARLTVEIIAYAGKPWWAYLLAAGGLAFALTTWRMRVRLGPAPSVAGVLAYGGKVLDLASLNAETAAIGPGQTIDVRVPGAAAGEAVATLSMVQSGDYAALHIVAPDPAVTLNGVSVDGQVALTAGMEIRVGNETIVVTHAEPVQTVFRRRLLPVLGLAVLAVAVWFLVQV